MGTPPEENSLACLMGTMKSQSEAEVGSSPMLENLDTGLGLGHCGSPVLENLDTAMHLEPRVYENLEMTIGICGRRRVLQRAEGNQESNEHVTERACGAERVGRGKPVGDEKENTHLARDEDELVKREVDTKIFCRLGHGLESCKHGQPPLRQHRCNVWNTICRGCTRQGFWRWWF